MLYEKHKNSMVLSQVFNNKVYRRKDNKYATEQKICLSKQFPSGKNYLN